MQNGVLAIVIGTSMLLLVLVGLRSRRRTYGSTQLTLGVLIGVVAAISVLVTGTDLVPDDIELGLMAATVVVLGGLLTYLALSRR